MLYKHSKEHLLKQGLIKKCPIDYESIKNLIKRAIIDLKTAKRNLPEDEECAYNYAYNAMLRSGLALMFSEGFRPEIKDKHLTIVQFANAELGKSCKDTIEYYDYMRKKRHKFIYEPKFPCSKKEAKDAIEAAENFVNKISKILRKNSFQKEFDF